jgi:hypothetical protein
MRQLYKTLAALTLAASGFGLNQTALAGERGKLAHAGAFHTPHATHYRPAPPAYGRVGNGHAYGHTNRYRSHRHYRAPRHYRHGYRHGYRDGYRSGHRAGYWYGPGHDAGAPARADRHAGRYGRFAQGSAHAKGYRR